MRLGEGDVGLASLVCTLGLALGCGSTCCGGENEVEKVVSRGRRSEACAPTMDGAGLVNMSSSRPSISSAPSSPGKRQRMPRSQSGSKPVIAMPWLNASVRPPPPAPSFPFCASRPSRGVGGGATSGWTVMSGLRAEEAGERSHRAVDVVPSSQVESRLGDDLLERRVHVRDIGRVDSVLQARTSTSQLFHNEDASADARAHLLLVDPCNTNHQIRRKAQRERLVRRCHLLAVNEEEEEIRVRSGVSAGPEARLAHLARL